MEQCALLLEAFSGWVKCHYTTISTLFSRPLRPITHYASSATFYEDQAMFMWGRVSNTMEIL